MDELAYGSGSTWRDICGNEPEIGEDGQVYGPWGDAIGAAVAFEKDNSDWSQFADAPVGQVIDALGQMSGDKVGNAEQTEEAFKSGARSIPTIPGLIQAEIIGAPVQEAMVIGGMGPHLACLDQHPRIEVKEKASFIEALTAALGMEIEMANRYQIFAEGGADELFYAVEQTDCCSRNAKNNCPDCAPWNVDILHHGGGGMYAKAFHMDRPCTFTCCCLNRPEVNIIDVMGGEQKIGSIIDPFAFCDLTFQIKDAAGEPVLKATGGCCQPGLICPLPCGPCSEVNFDIKDVANDRLVGNIKKKVPSCCKFMFASDVDNYYIEFGEVKDPKWKAMVMALSLFIDFRYFNDNKNDDNM